MVLLSVSLVSMVGCFGSSSGEVHGTVTLDGKPVEKGTIEFVPQDGQGPTAGAEIANGRYTVLQVPVGTATVRIRASKVVGEHRMSPDPNGPVIYDWQSIIPPRYNDQSQLSVEVNAGRQERPFDLVSQ
jgi:hypothetical protein